MPSPGLGGVTGTALGFALGAAAFTGVGGGVGLLLIIGMLVFTGVGCHSRTLVAGSFATGNHCCWG